jgi:hypothetical protein
MRLVPDDEATGLPTLEEKRSSDEPINYETTTSVDRLSKEETDRALRAFNELSDLFTTEKTLTDKRELNDLLFTTVEPVTEVNELKTRELEPETETDGPATEPERENELNTGNKQEIPIELTTSSMPLFPLTSSSIAPELNTPTTEKYTGLLKDETRRIKSHVEDKTEDDSKVRIAFYDQDALKKISNVPNDFMLLDETHDVVTLKLDTHSTDSVEHSDEVKPVPLNQGEASSHSEEKESDH